MANRFVRYGVGIDISMEDFHVCMSGLSDSEQVKIIATHKFSQSPKGIESCISWIKARHKQADMPLRIVLEVTGVYHEKVLFSLHQAGFHVSLVSAKRAKDYLRSLSQISKTDKQDSQGLAHLALHRREKAWEPISEQIYLIRELMRHRSALIGMRVQLQNQLHARNHARKVSSDVAHSLGELITNLKTKIDQAEEKAVALAEKDPAFWQRLKRIQSSVTGLGVVSLLTILSETNGFESFSSAKQVVKYAGLDIIENQSGLSNGKTRISKRGNAHLRAAMYMPALSLIRAKAQPLYALYLRLLARNGGLKKKAQVAVQRKLLVLVFTLWKNNTRFDPQYQHPAAKAAALKKLPQGPEKNSSSDETSELHRIDQAGAELPKIT
jgi:transposase